MMISRKQDVGRAYQYDGRRAIRIMSYVVLLYQDRLYSAQTEMPGTFTIGSGKKDSLQVEGMEQAQITIKENRKGKVMVNVKDPTPFYDDDVMKDSMIVLSREEQTALYLTDRTDTAAETLKLPYNCIVKFGRSDKNHVTIRSPYVSGKHFTLRSESGIIRVEDHDSTNGLYLNGKRISKARLHSGDVLSILHINIRLVNNELFIDNAGDSLTIRGIEEEHAIGGLARREDSGQGTLKYRRSPRTQEQLPTEDIILASAPNAAGKFEKRRGIFSSFLGTGAMFAANMAAGVASPALLAARAASLVSPVTSMVTQSGSEKQRKTKSAEYEQQRMEKYGQYIGEQKARIEAVAAVQREILTRENPPAVECVENLRQLNRSLWERAASDRDFLDVRLGMGYEKLCVQVKSREDGGFRMETDEVRELAERIVEETRIVDNVPARLSLRRYSTVSVIGNRDRMAALVRNMIVSLTTAHCFEEVRIVGIFDKEEQSRWESLRWLPHVWDENRQFRFLAFDGNRAHALCDLFSDTLKGRIKESGDGYRNSSQPLPHYIFLLGSRAYTEKEEIMQLLTSNNPELGATAIFLFDDLYSLPHSCQFIVDVDNGPCGYVRNEVNNKFFFTMDEAVSESQLDSFARQMSAIELEGFTTQADIPQGIRFLEGFGVSRVEQLDAMSRWQNSQPYRSLAAPIGVMGGEKVFSLDIHEKAHGPHGLVAGTTGSGKSELLQTWILSMALHYHPHDVVFVIIDYKGGGMANLLVDLPHVVGKITNIGSNIGRSLISLQSEMKRRQRIFDEYKEYQINHIDKYQKLYREGKAKEPLPHLIIVADEFAELKQNEPEFMAGLISASRIGRSLGVHLVLATQKPSGVVDEQIQSNSKFRLCLKVQNAGDSREMIRRPDAARITQAGRSYVLVGEEEVFELFQSYWSGAPYAPSVVSARDSGNSVRIVSISGERSKQVKKEKTTVHSDMDELTAIRQYLCRVAKENGIQKLAGPWLPELPVQLTLQDLNVPGGFDGREWRQELPWLKVPIGMYDAPAVQAQGIQYMDLAAEGHYGIYGAPATGKTSLLKTIVWALGKYYSPEDVNIYILDCGGWSMNVFAGMPHVGGIALDCEEEKFQKLQQMLTDEISQRKRRFLSCGVSSLTAYRQANGGKMPAIILAIDNLVPIFDQFPDMESLLVTVAREGAAYGIYMIYTANNTTGVRYKVLQNIRGAVAFELTDKGDYPTIVGRLDGMSLPKVTGRAFFRNNPPMEFQAAMYLAGDTERDRSEALKAQCARMDEAWQGPRPAVIPVMPEELSFEELFKNYRERTEIPVGISCETIRPAMADLTDRYNMLISGTMNSGKSRFLAGLAGALREKQPEAKLYVFDGQRGSLRRTASIATRYAACSQAQPVTEMLSEIVEMLNVRKRAQNQARSMAGDTFREQEFIADYEQIAIFIDDLKEFVDEVDNNNKNSMERICRLAQGLGVLVFAAGRVSDLERYNEIESLTRAIVANQKGIGMGGSAALHSFLRNDLSYKEKEQDAGEGNGFLFDEGHCSRIKLPE